MLPNDRPSPSGRPHAADEERIYAGRTRVPRTARDPVCHMNVLSASPHQLEFDGTTYRFCTARCLEKFRDWPGRYVHGASAPGS